MPKSNAKVAHLLAAVANLRGLARIAWDARYEDAGASVINAKRAIDDGRGLLDALANGLAHLTFAFHAEKEGNFAGARSALTDAFGELSWADDAGALACAQVVRARIELASDNQQQAVDALARAVRLFEDSRLVEDSRLFKDSISTSTRHDYAEALIEQASLARRKGAMGEAFAKLAQAASLQEQAQKPCEWLNVLYVVGLASLFIRSHEFRGAVNLLGTVRHLQGVWSHAWGANMIAALLREGDRDGAALVARTLLATCANRPTGETIGWVWATIACIEACADGGSKADAYALAQQAAGLCSRAAACEPQSPSRTTQAECARALVAAQGDTRAAYDVASHYLASVPEGFPTELLAYMYRWAERAAAAVGDAAGATRWALLADALEKARDATPTMATLLGRVLRVSDSRKLTEAQRAVVSHMAQGETAEKTARKTGQSLSQVRALLRGACEAYNCKSTRGLIAAAAANGEIVVAGELQG
jgi:DNA-binding CsgD family transcriptional regulator